MENKPTKPTTSTKSEPTYKVYGTVRDTSQQLMPAVAVNVFNKTMRGKTLLGTAVTGDDGTYTIAYTLKNAKTAALIIGAYDADGKPFQENAPLYDIPADLQVDFDLSGKAFAGPSDYERLMDVVAPFTDEVPLAKMTETADEPDLSFIAQKTGLDQNIVEQLAMAARFETLSSISASVWYGLLMCAIKRPSTAQAAPADFEGRLNQVFNQLMHMQVGVLVSALQQAINANAIAYQIIADVPAITKELTAQIVAYANKHPVTGSPSVLVQKAQIGGLSGTDLQKFVKAHVTCNGTDADFWQKVKEEPVLSDNSKATAVQAAFKLADLTGSNLPLTQKLFDNHDISTVSDIKQLAGYSRQEWADMLKTHQVRLDSSVPGETDDDKIQHYAARLDSAFTNAYPTATFTARLQKDTANPLPEKDKVTQFLRSNGNFDLLNHHVGTFLKENPDAAPAEDHEAVAENVRRVQRVMKLTPNYDHAAALLNDNIHSAQQVYKMGQDNFVRAYSDQMGEAQATQVFQKASAVHASALALTSNLKSMADASSIKAFPNFSAAITQQLSTDLPNLDTLFGHADYCECDECSSVYGASAYLTDILHYLAQRKSQPGNNSSPSVKDILLNRRPDLANIDLTCDNTNTQVPYIDIACELMEDFISPPIITLANSFVASFVEGPIPAALLTAIKTQFTSAGLANVATLLTAAASISASYTVTPLLDNNTFGSLTQYIIRDAQIALRASIAAGTGATVEVRVLHQTFEDSDTINAGPEYVNTNVYTNFLGTAKAPFSLPFDLYETEGELYLQQLGIKKADLIDIFRKEDHTPPGTSVSDVRLGNANLGINLAEQALIFTADPTHQSIYWGGATADITTEAEIDTFQGLTNLTYDQILSLISLQFINPKKDIVIQHNNLDADVTTQKLINLDGTKLDAMHRFLRLWRKTTFSLQEMDAIIMAAKMGAGAIPVKLPYFIHLLTNLQQKLQLSVFEVLAFYQNIDTTYNLPDCLYNQLFQNSAITNPVNTNFSISTATTGTTGIVETDKPVLAAILQISVSDVNLLLAKTNSKISLANLSLMFRCAKLAQGLDLSITDLLTLTNLIDANPFLDLVSTTLFINKYNLLKSSGFSIDELNYILRHQDNLSHTLVPSAGQITNALTQVQTSFLAINAATQPAPDPNGQLLAKWLSDGVFNWDPGMLSRFIDILNTVDDTVYQQKITNNTNFLNNLRFVYHDAMITADLPALPLDKTGVQIVIPASISAQLTYNADTKQLQLVGYMSSADQAALLALVAGSTTDPNVALYTTAVNAIFTQAQLTDSSVANTFFTTTNTIATVLNTKLGGNTAARFSYFVNLVSPIYIRLQQQKALVKCITNWFGIDKTVAAQLLASIPGIYTDFSAANFIGKVVPVTNSVQVNRYLSLAKIGLIASKLKLTPAELAFQVAHAVDITSLDITALPLAPVTTAVTTFPGFEAFINLLAFDQAYPTKVTNVATNATISVYSILTDAIAQKKAAITGTVLTTWTAALVANLSLLTGWNQADLSTLIGAGGDMATLILPADILSVPILMRLNQRLTMQQQLGIAISDAFIWTKDALTAADTAKIKQVVKSKYVNSDWLQISKTAQDTLREKKRDALIAYLLANPGTQGWKTADDLYAFFLMDVQMCSCQPTSRIVQATNAVQLFVQRCFMQLESNISVVIKPDPRFPNLVADSDWAQWQWMKNFRLWQSNQKVFLWPENYIEPELLPVDVKSSFFSDLENDLLQGEVTADNVEEAFSNYLSKLRDVAKLEIKGTWYDDPSQTFYVFARTYGGDPKTYYFRKLLQSTRWTPWEKVNIVVDGEFVFPVVYNGHLYLFWALFKQQADPNSTQAKPLPPHWIIQIAYSEYNNGKWSAKKTSTDSSNSLTVDGGKYPDMTKFMFFQVDLPDFDYSDPNKSPDQTGDYKSLATLTASNGTIVIACNYYTYDPTFLPPRLNISDYIGSFEIDLNGNPVKVDMPLETMNLETGFKDVITATPPTVFSNMKLVPATVNAPPVVHGLTVPDPKGIPERIINFQMDRVGRFEFVQGLVPNNPTPVAAFSAVLPFFYQDKHSTYFVQPEDIDANTKIVKTTVEIISEFFNFVEINNRPPQLISDKTGVPFIGFYRFLNHYHPYVPEFMKTLFKEGIDGLMSRNTQLKGDPIYDKSTNQFNFATFYPELVAGSGVSANVFIPPMEPNTAPSEDVDFSLESGYGLYNWELFYHAPLMIAERLSLNQQFDDADRWYRYIFNPMDTSSDPVPNKFWNTKPFFEASNTDYTAQSIDQILKNINDPSNPVVQNTLIQNVKDWRNNPFQPHFIAETRTVAYQKVAVMKYVGHLIRYGDYLFAQDTMESVNQATQLYIVAAEILGPKPQVLPSPVVKPIENYSQLEQKLDAVSDAIINVENLVPLQTISGYTGIKPGPNLPTLQTRYFCLPMNENLAGPTGYWDVVADRLFKIRHCLNIDGTLAPLALFSPVINPSLLVRATAAGLDLGDILNDLNAPLPIYRFATITQKATELCVELKSLGSLLLSALEKKDAEALSVLRASQETKLLTAVALLKKKQIDDAQAAIDLLNKQKESATLRQQYYSDLISGGLSGWEIGAMALNATSIALDAAIALSYFAAAGADVAPDVFVGALAGGVASGAIGLTKDGGSNAGSALANIARNLGSLAGGVDKIAALTSVNAGYDRRSQEWQFQLNLANKDLEQFDKQIANAQLRLEIAQQDADNQQLQIDQSNETSDFLTSKFTNEDLYNFMITQVSNTYFKTYQLTYALAKKAEQCFRYELALSDSSYINFGYWDSLRKGLTAGEQLYYDIKAMEVAYLDQNTREQELTKSISLSQLDPVALLKLKTTGECWVNLPEELFDMDYPGHYMRRIKSVSLTIPCVAGPYTTVSCKLTMTNNSMRVSPLAAQDPAQYPRKMTGGASPVPADDPRFRDSVGALQSISTSSAQNDSGLFELNFRDERYLPFEGAGAISLWHLQLPAAVRQFDYDTISDVIIHLKYTSRDGGDLLKANATTSLTTKINQMLVSTKDSGLMSIFSAKNDLPSEWYRFLNPVNTTDDQVLTLTLDQSRFPLFVQGRTIKIKSVELVADTSATAINGLVVTPAPTAPATINLTKTNIYGNFLSIAMTYNNDPGTWTIKNPVANTRLTAATLKNLVVIVHYTVA